MPRAVPRHQRPRGRRKRTLWMIGGAIVSVFLVGGLIFLNAKLSQRVSRPTVSTGRVWGQAHAPVSIEVFSDFQCPVCARADAVLHRLAPQYIDTGKAKVIYRHFAFLGSESHWAAQAAECAGEQHRFWDYAQYLFTHQAGENVGAFAHNRLKRFAQQIGLEPTAFYACLDSGRYATVVEQDTQEGRNRGVQATPTFFVRGQRIEGLLSTDQLAALIEWKPSHE
jgi:protein-disulfide isomerase